MNDRLTAKPGTREFDEQFLGVAIETLIKPVPTHVEGEGGMRCYDMDIAAATVKAKELEDESALELAMRRRAEIDELKKSALRSGVSLWV